MAVKEEKPVKEEKSIKDGKSAKREWKKEEKALYLPKKNPEIIEVPPLNFFVLEGQGNPNSPFFAECIEALYGASYAVRMSNKGKVIPEGYYEYTVYPLEGVWDLTEEGKAKQAAQLAEVEAEAGGLKRKKDVSSLKDEFVFKLMIRQPDFLTPELGAAFIQEAAKKKKNPLIEKIYFTTVEEGKCIQILHEGSYDSEPESFEKMEIFAEEKGLRRMLKTHREIYLSDARKTSPEALKTVLRFQVE